MKNKLRVVRLMTLLIALGGAFITYGFLMFVNLTSIFGVVGSIVISILGGLFTAFGYALTAIGGDWDE